VTTPGNNGLKHYGSIMLKGSMAQTLSHGATNLVSFLLLPIITEYLSPEDFGIFSMVASVVVFFNLIYNPGILSATTRQYHDTTSELERRTLI
jgi:O-antigen/teichoic acid export membrane protein